MAEAEAEAAAGAPRRASLARRMGLIAAAWISVLLLGGGIALERTLTAQVESNFDGAAGSTGRSAGRAMIPGPRAPCGIAR